MAKKANEAEAANRAYKKGLGGDKHDRPDREERQGNQKPKNKPPKPDDTKIDDDITGDDGGEEFTPGQWNGQGPPPAHLVAMPGTKQYRRAIDARRAWEGDQLHRIKALGGLNPEDPDSRRRALEQLGIWEFKPSGEVSHKWKLWNGLLPQEGFGMTPTGAGSLNAQGQPNTVDVPEAFMRFMPDWQIGLHQALQGGHLVRDAATGLYVNPDPGGNTGTPSWYDAFGNPTTAPYAGAYQRGPVNPNTPATPASNPGTFQWSTALGGPQPQGFNPTTGNVDRLDAAGHKIKERQLITRPNNRGMGGDSALVADVGNKSALNPVSGGPSSDPMQSLNNPTAASSAGPALNIPGATPHHAPAQQKQKKLKSLFGEPVQWSPMA